MIDMEAVAAARKRYRNAVRAVKLADDRMIRFRHATAEACFGMRPDTDAERDAAKCDAAVEAEATYHAEVWYPAWREAGRAARHLAKTLGLNSIRFGEFLR